MTTQTQAQAQDPYTLLFTYLDKIIEILRPRIAQLAEKHGLELLDIYYQTQENKDRIDYTIVVELIDMNTIAQLWIEGVEDSCSSWVSQMIEAGEIDENEADNKWEECVETEIEEWKSQYCSGPAFEFTYENNPIEEAQLDVYEYDRGDLIECGDKLIIRYHNSITKDAVGIVATSNQAVDYTANSVSALVEKIIEAYRALRG